MIKFRCTQTKIHGVLHCAKSVAFHRFAQPDEPEANRQKNNTKKIFEENTDDEKNRAGRPKWSMKVKKESAERSTRQTPRRIDRVGDVESFLRRECTPNAEEFFRVRRFSPIHRRTICFVSADFRWFRTKRKQRDDRSNANLADHSEYVSTLDTLRCIGCDLNIDDDDDDERVTSANSFDVLVAER